MSAAKCRGCRQRFETDRVPGRRGRVYCDECRRRRNAESQQRVRDARKAAAALAVVVAVPPELAHLPADKAALLARLSPELRVKALERYEAQAAAHEQAIEDGTLATDDDDDEF